MIEDITPDFQIQIADPCLLYRNKFGEIHGLWFYNSAERERVILLLERIIGEKQGQIQLQSNGTSTTPARGSVSPSISTAMNSNASINSSPAQLLLGGLNKYSIPSTSQTFSNSMASPVVQSTNQITTQSSSQSTSSANLNQSMQSKTLSKIQLQSILSDLVKDSDFIDLVYKEYLRMNS